MNKTYRGIKLHWVLCDHCSNSLIWAIAAVISWLHDSGMSSPYLLHCDDTMGNIELKITARRWINNDHDRNTLGMEIWNQTRTLVRVMGVQLDQMSAFSNLPLNYIIKRIKVLRRRGMSLILLIKLLVIHSYIKLLYEQLYFTIV